RRDAHRGAADLARLALVDLGREAGERALQVAERVRAHPQFRAERRPNGIRQGIAERAAARELHVAVRSLTSRAAERLAVRAVDALRHRDEATAEARIDTLDVRDEGVELERFLRHVHE